MVRMMFPGLMPRCIHAKHLATRRGKTRGHGPRGKKPKSKSSQRVEDVPPAEIFPAHELPVSRASDAIQNALFG